MKTLTTADRIMFHAHYAPYVSIIIASGILCAQAAFQRIKQWKHLRAICTFAITVMLASSPFVSFKFLHFKTNTERTLLFLQKNLPDVPPGSVLVTFLQEDLEPGSGLSVPFPLYHPLFGNNVALVSIKEYLSGSRPQSRDRRILYFESPMCYTFDLKALALQEFGATKKPSYRAVTGFSARFNSTREHKKRELCRQMDELFEMHALKKVEFTSHPDTICPVYQKKITIGLFDVSGPKDRHNH